MDDLNDIKIETIEDAFLLLKRSILDSDGKLIYLVDNGANDEDNVREKVSNND